jgi:hypothetical protein
LNISDGELPPNRQFGLLFSVIFIAIGAYLYLESRVTAGCGFLALGLLFFALTLTKADALQPLNKLWMRFGFLLGLIVSPIVLGIIFFGLFTPISILMRLFGRDELRLRLNHKVSHWISPESPKADTGSFKNQF